MVSVIFDLQLQQLLAPAVQDELGFELGFELGLEGLRFLVADSTDQLSHTETVPGQDQVN